MKQTLTTLLLLFALNGMGQTRPLYPKDTLNFSRLIGTGTRTGFGTLQQQPQSYIFTGVINGKEMLKIDVNKIPIDSLILHTRKKQTYWLNDSTLIIKKP